MREFLARQFRHFESGDFWSTQSFIEAKITFLCWAIPAVLFVMLVEYQIIEGGTYTKAITEGIGPNLWNIIGIPGLFLFGLSLVFISSERIVSSARRVLSNVYGIGCLSWSLLFAQWLFLDTSEFTWWQEGLWNITSAFLMLVVLFFNLVVWYLSWLLEVRNESSFLKKLASVHTFVRVGIALFIFLVIYISLCLSS